MRFNRDIREIQAWLDREFAGSAVKLELIRMLPDGQQTADTWDRRPDWQEIEESIAFHALPDHDGRWALVTRDPDNRAHRRTLSVIGSERTAESSAHETVQSVVDPLSQSMRATVAAHVEIVRELKGFTLDALRAGADREERSATRFEALLERYAAAHMDRGKEEKEFLMRALEAEREHNAMMDSLMQHAAPKLIEIGSKVADHVIRSRESVIPTTGSE